MPKRVAIITDSTSDMPAELVARYEIEVVPLYVTFGTNTLRDGVELPSPMFFERLQTDPNHPTTSQPTPADFVEAYNRARDAIDAEEVVAITISEELSGTYDSAVAAQKMVDFPVHVLDSRTTTMGLTLATVAAAEAAEQGASGAQVASAAQAAIDNVRLFFVVDTLEYLHKGGRIGTASRFIGTALSIKPVLQVADGAVQAFERVRTKKRALARLVNLLDELADPDRPLFLAVGQGEAREDMQWLINEINARHTPEKLYQIEVGATIGTHTGPGVVGYSFYQL
jgi:DegV family protein with EDD domain